MSESLKLFLDLGDVFSKGVAVRAGRVRRIRYPSMTATRLIDPAAPATDLLLDGVPAWPRPHGFDAARYPRTRSYPEAQGFLESAWALHGEAPAGARFAGYSAAAYGEDRVLLGQEPSDANVDALVRKAFLMTAEGCSRADVTLIVETGVKAAALTRYAEPAERSVELQAWRFARRSPRPMRLKLSLRVVDAVDCALAALPEEVSARRSEGLLLLDIGYLRSKLALVTDEGCVHQEELDKLGFADCVRRILRDGQDQELFEDELAVMYALERSQTTIDVAGRRFEVADTLEAARRALSAELARAVQRALVAHVERGGEAFRSVAVLGGSASVMGPEVERPLGEQDLGLTSVWVTDEPSFLLGQGARRARG